MLLSPPQFLHRLPSPRRFWLLFWAANNIGVTLLNKIVFSKANFHYPYFLSAVHMLINFVGCQYIFSVIDRERRLAEDSSENWSDEPVKEHQRPPHPIVRLMGFIQRKHLDENGRRLIMGFSIIFSANIAFGNVSLRHVSVNFNQVMRSLVPAVTIALGWGLLGKSTSRRRQMAVVPVMIGVAMATFGDMSFTGLGLFYTVLCVLLAAGKAVASGEMLTGRNIKMHPVDLLANMAPLAFVQCMVMSLITGEVTEIRQRWHTEFDPFAASAFPMFALFLSGLTSFTLNISSLQANKLTSPLTLCIAANVKQVTMIVISTIFFHIDVSPLNGAGIVVVLIGSAIYSYVSVREKMSMDDKKKMSSLPSALEASADAVKRQDQDDDGNSVSTESCTSTSGEGDEVEKDEGNLEVQSLLPPQKHRMKRFVADV